MQLYNSRECHNCGRKTEHGCEQKWSACRTCGQTQDTPGVPVAMLDDFAQLAEEFEDMKERLSTACWIGALALVVVAGVLMALAYRGAL